METTNIIKVFSVATISFLVAMAWTPLLTKLLYKFKLGKRIRDDGKTPVFSGLHSKKAGTPTMGGVLIWLTVLVIIFLFSYLAGLFPGSVFAKLNFLSRGETLLPLGALVASAVVGLIDDYLDVKGLGRKGGGGLTVSYRLLIYAVIAIVGAWWFFVKLEWDVIHVPFAGNFEIGAWYIPIFIFIIVATAFSVNETDGLDGLAGGTLMIAFGAYGVIAFAQGRYDLAAFCAAIGGALLAFLWFNINPAKFFMGDTGAMSLGVTIGIVALLTNAALFLPFIGFVWLVESISVIIQILSKKFRGKKIFLSAPIHHHYEGKGWPETTVVMRFWVLSGVMATIGLILFLLDKV